MGIPYMQPDTFGKRWKHVAKRDLFIPFRMASVLDYRRFRLKLPLSVMEVQA